MSMISVYDVRTALESVGIQELDIPNDESLFESGILDSLWLMNLVPALESRFSVEIKPTDLTPSNFDTLAGMTNFLAQRSAGNITP